MPTKTINDIEHRYFWSMAHRDLICAADPDDEDDEDEDDWEEWDTVPRAIKNVELGIHN